MVELSNRKKIFAIYLSSHPSDPYEAAMEAFDGDVDMSLDNYLDWLYDDDIRDYVSKHKSASNSLSTEAPLIPSADEVSVDAYHISKKVHSTPDEKLKALKLLSDIQGYIKKPDNITNVQVNSTNKVMYIRDSGSDDDWEAKLLNQQQDLLTVRDDDVVEDDQYD